MHGEIRVERFFFASFRMTRSNKFGFYFKFSFPPPMHQRGQPFAQPHFAAQSFDRRQQGDAGDSHEDVGGPDAEPGGHGAVASQRSTKDKDDVIAADQRYRQNKSGGAPSAAGT